MKLSPLELRKHQFEKRFRLKGYDPDEVNGFLRQMADQWGEVLEENRRMEDRIRELESKLTHYEKVELALQEALETARNTARQVEDNAIRKAELTVESAELRAQRMLQDAEQERYSIKQDLVKLNSRQSEIAARMRAFLMAEMEVLAQFQGDDPTGFIRLISASEAAPAGRLAESAGPPAIEEIVPTVATAEEAPSEVQEEEDALEAEVEETEVEAAASAPVEEPTSTIEPPPAHELISTDEPSATIGEEPVEAPSPAFSILDRAESAVELESDAHGEAETLAVPYPPMVEQPPPVPIQTYTAAAQQEPPPIPKPVAPLETAMPDPVWPPIEEPTIMPPVPEPRRPESVEELNAETPLPPAFPVEPEEFAPRPTYRDMLSGSQAESAAESRGAPFNSSFFETPFLDRETSGETSGEADADGPAADSDSAHDWSLRSLVTGDGDSETTSSSPSDAERDRIRRILEDLD